MSSSDSLTITRPDDWHVHLRDGETLPHTVRDIARYFGRAIVMPNLVPPVVTVQDAAAYYERIKREVPEASQFEPLMTLYLTEQTRIEAVRQASNDELVHAFKLYPAGTTTHAEFGIRSIESSYPVFAEMEKQEIPLLLHAEVNTDDVDIFDREAVFIDRHLIPLTRQFPDLRIVFEHITTTTAVQYIEATFDKVAATITAHHLMYNRNDMLAGGMRPVYYCLPILKRKQHQQALLKAATSGNPAYFLGTDSAPHPRSTKENSCGCAAGCYTAHAALELYAEVFEGLGKLDRLENFASHFGADFYGLPRNSDTIKLVKQSWDVPDTISFGANELVPIKAGQQVAFKVVPE
ncbi:MAG: dihydroorotase [Gammaproteobacteria bacterium]|nr:dihydroorotase [Gammaproteobacteria bacterium]